MPNFFLYSTNELIVINFKLCSLAKIRKSFLLAIVPSSCITSDITPAGNLPAGVISEVMHDDGTMARRND